MEGSLRAKCVVGHQRIRWWFAYANQGATPVKKIMEKADFCYEEVQELGRQEREEEERMRERGFWQLDR